MGYYSSLIQRKYKDLVGKQYDKVLRDYSMFLLTEEEMTILPVRSILMPLDVYVRDVTPVLYDVISAYDAVVTMVYITDAQVVSVLKQTLDEAAALEFLKRKEDQAQRLMDRVGAELKSAGIASQQRMFAGRKGEDVERMAADYDLVVLSRSYGAEVTEATPVSPNVLRISQSISKPTIIY